MARRSAGALLSALASAAVVAWSGCFGGDDGSGDAPDARTTDSRLEPHVKVERIVYSSSGGSRVRALFATPRGVAPRGCLIWQNHLSSREEDLAEIWDGAARLGLAVFSIDFPGDAQRALADPSRLAPLVRGSLADLKRGLDYLEGRECRVNFGYGGVGVGGMLGTVLAGRDRRIRATVIASTPPTWRSLTTAGQALSPLDPIRWVPRISPRPVMIGIGRKDPLVPV